MIAPGRNTNQQTAVILQRHADIRRSLNVLQQNNRGHKSVKRDTSHPFEQQSGETSAVINPYDFIGALHQLFEMRR